MATYALEGPKWASNVITWSFAAPGGSFTDAITGAYQAVIEQAFARWAQVTNVTFQQVATGTAGVDIQIGWSTFPGSPLVPGGSQIGETDYTYATANGTQTFMPGMEVRIEDPAADSVGATTTSTYQGTATTLYQVALHEIGHALGLGLDSNPTAVMYLTLGPADTDLSASDIAGVDSLYGAATSVAPQAAPAASVAIPSPITLTGNQAAVYRFFDQSNGTEFLTSSLGERNTTIQTRPDLSYEGLGMAAIAQPGSDPAAVPVYRLFDTQSGTHLFTASAAEEQNLIATEPQYVLEGSDFYEDATQQAGDVPVYRFFEETNGSHFYTTSADERTTLTATRPDMVYEGIAFYAPSPS